jgi:hypothetical protein
VRIKGLSLVLMSVTVDRKKKDLERLQGDKTMARARFFTVAIARYRLGLMCADS